MRFRSITGSKDSMKPSEVWLPKGRTHSGRDGAIECTQKRPWNWLADMVWIGVLILTAMGILAISDALQKKGVTGKLDPTELNVQNVRQEHGRSRLKAH